MISHRCRLPAAEQLEQRLYLAATIIVNTSQTAQTIQALGGNYAIDKYGDFYLPGNDAVGQYTLANLQPKATRIGIPLRGWAPNAFSANPNSINFADFGTNVAAVTNVFVLMQSLKAEGATITASIWDAPNWMMSNPTATQGRIVLSNVYPQLIESIAAFLIRADTVYNVRVDYLSFNEPDGGGFRLQFSGTQMGNFIAQAGPAFAQLGLAYTPKWLVGDTGNAERAVAYDTPILQNAAAAPYLGPIAFHGWDSITYDPSVFAGIVALAQQYNKPIWCTELGYDAVADQESPVPFPTWTYAINTAETYYTVMKLAQTSVNDYWEMQNDFPLLQTSPTVLYPVYYVVQTLMQNFVPGTQMVAANSTTTSVESMAALDPASGRLAIELINIGKTTTQTVTVTGLPAGFVMQQTRSDATENAVNEGTLTADSSGRFTFSLPPQTVSTLWGFMPVSVTSSQLLYASVPNQIAFSFNQNVGLNALNLASLAISSSGLPPVTPTGFSYNSSTRTAMWTLPTTLADGVYTATLTASILPQSSTLPFFSLMGDANHDGVVNALDFNVVATNFGKTSGMSFATGDFNGDGTVNSLDFNALAANFGKQFVPAPGAIQMQQMLPQSHAVQSSAPINLFSAQPVQRNDVLPTDSARVDSVLL